MDRKHLFERENETHLHKPEEDDDDSCSYQGDDDEDESREAHNAMERVRRDHIGRLFGELRATLDRKQVDPNAEENTSKVFKEKTLNDTLTFMETYTRKMKLLQDLRNQVDAVMSGNEENAALQLAVLELAEGQDTDPNDPLGTLEEEGEKVSAGSSYEVFVGPSGYKRPRVSGKNASKSKQQQTFSAKSRRKGKD